MNIAFSTKWIEPISLNDEGIVVGNDHAFGIGTLLVLRCRATHRFLMGRKSFREGFEGSNQFTFPGGMLRSESPSNFDACLAKALQARVLAESGVSIASIDHLVPLDNWPPIVGRYVIRGNQMVSAAILPCYGETDTELTTAANDPTVHSVGWYDPLEVMHEITQTNALIMAQVIWPECSPAQQEKIRPILQPHFEIVRENAELVGAIAPVPPWGAHEQP